MSHSNLPLKRTSTSQRRLLGEARRETAEAVHVAASKRRRLATAFDADADADDPADDDDNVPTAIASGALGDDDVAVFADAVYEDDDKEADFIYEQVDLRMQSRRQRQRDMVLQQQLKDYRDANPTVRQQFADVKQQLEQVSPEEWATIPEIGDYSVKKQKFQKFTPAPDSLLERARQENAHVAADLSGTAAQTDLAALGAGRTSVLEHNLDLAEGTSVNIQTVDHDGYLSAMTGANISVDADIADVKKARLLLKSIITTNPTHAPGWIAAARLEEKVGKMSVARTLVLEGTRKCPRDEEVWIEAARLHPPNIGRGILARAVRNVPKSVMVWMKAAELENDGNGKRRVLRKALEIFPQSLRLWQAAVELEDPAGARALLTEAVESAPNAVELWLALAKLEPYAVAKNVLKRARNANPRDASVVITQAELEEVQFGHEAFSIRELIADGINTTGAEKEVWMKHAMLAEQADHIGTVQAIVHQAIGLGVPLENRLSTWKEDATLYENQGFIHIARAVHEHLTETFANTVELWQKFAYFERRRDPNGGNVKLVLTRAVKACSSAEVLWLMLAKEALRSDGIEGARVILRSAFEAIPNAEGVWVAASKVELESGNLAKARELLTQARNAIHSPRVWMKSALLERRSGEKSAEREVLCLGLDVFPADEKLWLMFAQLFERGIQQNGQGMYDHNVRTEAKAGSKAKTGSGNPWWSIWNALDAYKKGVERCRKSAALWIGYCRLEEASGAIAKARAILERGREHCKGMKDEDLVWRESVYLEVRAGKPDTAKNVLARGLQECRASGRLWALAVGLERHKAQKTRSVDAIKACPQDPWVILEVAKYIWRSGNVEKTRSWLERAVSIDDDFGDAWATLYIFEKAHGTAESVQKVENRAKHAEPRHGDAWQSVSKKVGNECFGALDILRQASSMVSKESNITGLW